MIYEPADQSISIGILHSNRATAGGTPNVLVRVKNIDEFLNKTKDLGGMIAVPKSKLNGGWFAFIAAPDGNLIGLQE